MRAHQRTTAADIRITPRDEDYSKWYLDVIAAADLAEYGPTKGSMIIKPTGYALWEQVQKFLDEKFKDKGVENVYFPMLIPERFLKKEESHVEGFSPEVAVVTHAGGEKLEEPLIVRPTSETIMYDTFSRWIRSHKDLPVLINQWANVLRWEMRPRLFLRTTEFLWQEGHTAHKTPEESDAFAREMLEVYKWFAEKIMAIPVIDGVKTESERFAGALHTYCIEAMMQDGKALQFATSHNLGENFARAFDITYLADDDSKQYVSQTSWGLSTRSIGGLIMAHSDDKGLVLPPRIAPVKVVIIPIWKSDETKEQVLAEAEKIHDALIGIYGNTAIVLDDRDGRPGSKHYLWEKKGVPLRIEIGPRDIENKSVMMARRDEEEKKQVALETLVETVSITLEAMQQDLYKKALMHRNEHIVDVSTWDEFTKTIEEGNFVRAYWDGTAETEKAIKDETKATIRCIAFADDNAEEGVCIKTGAPTTTKVIFARSY